VAISFLGTLAGSAKPESNPLASSTTPSLGVVQCPARLAAMAASMESLSRTTRALTGRF
jgi:hypothetical protein